MGNEYFILGSHPVSKKIRSVLRKAKIPFQKIELSSAGLPLNPGEIPRSLIYCDDDLSAFHNLIIPWLLKIGQDIPVMVFTSDELPDELLNIYPEELMDRFYEPVDDHEFLASMKQLEMLSESMYELRQTVGKLRAIYQELSIFRKIDKSLLTNQEHKKILSEILEKITSYLKAEAWSLMLYNENKGELVFEISKGTVGEDVKKFSLKLGQGIAGWVAQHRQPVLVPDASSDKRFFEGVDKATQFKTQSLLAVPLMVRGKLVGVVELVNRKDGRPFDENDLTILQTICGHAGIALETTVLSEMTKILSITDDLTGLYNARFLHEALEVELEKARANNRRVSFIFMDLDHFKKVNDQFGHLHGRKVLKEVAHAIKKEIKDAYSVARYGGDEFVIVLPDAELALAMAIAEKIRVRIENETFLAEENLNIKLTASFGVSCFPENAESKDDLINIADNAMFSAKRNNRNTVYMAESFKVPRETF